MAIVLDKPIPANTIEIIETIRICQELGVIPSVLEQEDPLWIDRLKTVFMADAQRAKLDQERAKAKAEMRKRHGTQP